MERKRKKRDKKREEEKEITRQVLDGNSHLPSTGKRLSNKY